ncbi:MAG: hypothetical protein AB7W59_02410 [Acidimicrobiia bacterium]
MDREHPSEHRLRPRGKRWKVALALVGFTAASLTMAGEASAATVCKPSSTVVAIKSCDGGGGGGASTMGVRW